MSKPATRTLSVTAGTSKKSAKSGLNEIREDSPSQLIDGRIKELSDWRGETLAGSEFSSSKRTPKWSRSGSGEAFRCGSTTESSAPARRTGTS